MTGPEREAHADVETEALFLERRMAEASLLSAQEAGRSKPANWRRAKPTERAS